MADLSLLFDVFVGEMYTHFPIC